MPVKKEKAERKTSFALQSLLVAAFVFIVAFLSFAVCTPSIVRSVATRPAQAAWLIASPAILAFIANYVGIVMAARTRLWLAGKKVEGLPAWTIYALFLVPAALLFAVVLAVFVETDMGDSLIVLLLFLAAYVLFAHAIDNRIRDLMAVRDRKHREQNGHA